MSTPSSYSTIVSPRSRRLRTTGILLLSAVVLMVIYGYFGLMPALRRSIRPSAPPVVSSRPTQGSPPFVETERERRVRKLKASAGLAYWGVCSLLLVGAVFVAWLDLREISRNYVAERRAIWHQEADQIKSTDEST